MFFLCTFQDICLLIYVNFMSNLLIDNCLPFHHWQNQILSEKCAAGIHVVWKSTAFIWGIFTPIVCLQNNIPFFAVQEITFDLNTMAPTLLFHISLSLTLKLKLPVFCYFFSPLAHTNFHMHATFCTTVDPAPFCTTVDPKEQIQNKKGGGSYLRNHKTINRWNAP